MTVCLAAIPVRHPVRPSRQKSLSRHKAVGYHASVRRLLISLLFISSAAAQPPIDPSEYQARRRAAMEKVPDSIVALHSVSGLKRWDESGFHQDASFYAFTGLANMRGAILVLDGTDRQSWLFVMPRSGSFGADLRGRRAVCRSRPRRRSCPKDRSRGFVGHVYFFRRCAPQE